jgi:hypothetical protein
MGPARENGSIYFHEARFFQQIPFESDYMYDMNRKFAKQWPSVAKEKGNLAHFQLLWLMKIST